jgi:hypothetical protein
MTRSLPLLLQDVGPWVWGPIGFIVLLVVLFIWSRYKSAKAMAEAKSLMPKPHPTDGDAAPDSSAGPEDEPETAAGDPGDAPGAGG